MIELNKGGRRIEIYDSVKKIPAGRLMGFQLHLLQHSNCGSTFDEVDANCQRIDEYYEAGRIEDARRARENQRMGFWLMFQDINSSTVALAHLVHAIDGVAVQVTTDAEMLRVAKLLEATDITQEEVDELLDRVKKK